MKLKIGDLIHQTKDNIVFLIVKIDKQDIYLEYYDSTIKCEKQVKTTRKNLNNLICGLEPNSRYIKYYGIAK